MTGVYWLDFFEELLNFNSSNEIVVSAATAGAGAGGAPGVTLKPEFSLDGTHLNPSYLALVEAAFNKLLSGKSGK